MQRVSNPRTDATLPACAAAAPRARAARRGDSGPLPKNFRVASAASAARCVTAPFSPTSGPPHTHPAVALARSAAPGNALAPRRSACGAGGLGYAWTSHAVCYRCAIQRRTQKVGVNLIINSIGFGRAHACRPVVACPAAARAARGARRACLLRERGTLVAQAPWRAADAVAASAVVPARGRGGR